MSSGAEDRTRTCHTVNKHLAFQSEWRVQYLVVCRCAFSWAVGCGAAIAPLDAWASGEQPAPFTKFFRYGFDRYLLPPASHH